MESSEQNNKTVEVQSSMYGLTKRMDITKERNCEIKYRTIKLTSLNNREKHT